jgi:hypothetical protein
MFQKYILYVPHCPASLSHILLLQFIMQCFVVSLIHMLLLILVVFIYYTNLKLTNSQLLYFKTLQYELNNGKEENRSRAMYRC